MPTSTLTSKGQVTIPKRVRDQLRLQTGDRLDFQVEEDGTVRVSPISRKVGEVFGAFASKGLKRRSAAEIKRELKKAFREGRV